MLDHSIPYVVSSPFRGTVFYLLLPVPAVGQSLKVDKNCNELYKDDEAVVKRSFRAQPAVANIEINLGTIVLKGY